MCLRVNTFLCGGDLAPLLLPLKRGRSVLFLRIKPTLIFSTARPGPLSTIDVTWGY